MPTDQDWSVRCALHILAEVYIEGSQDEAGESDAAVAAARLWSCGDASLAGALMGLAGCGLPI